MVMFVAHGCLPVKGCRACYASKASARARAAASCRHARLGPTHITFLIGVASGIAHRVVRALVLIAQPAEELRWGQGDGQDGLYDRVPKPDVLIASRHPGHPAGAPRCVPDDAWPAPINRRHHSRHRQSRLAPQRQDPS